MSVKYKFADSDKKAAFDNYLRILSSYEYMDNIYKYSNDQDVQRIMNSLKESYNQLNGSYLQINHDAQTPLTPEEKNEIIDKIKSVETDSTSITFLNDQEVKIDNKTVAVSNYVKYTSTKHNN